MSHPGERVMNERFERIVELIPAALDVVLYKSEAVVDDTCLSRLLSWLERACSNPNEKSKLLQSVVGDFVLRVCAEGEHSVAIAFGLKLSAVNNAVVAHCWKETLRFISEGRIDVLRHEDAAVRCAAYGCLRRLTRVPEAVLLICETDLVAKCLFGLHDNSMFVSQAAAGFLCNWLHSSGGLHQPSANVTCYQITLQTAVSGVLDHFRSFFNSSSLQRDVSSVFIFAKEFMEVSIQTAGFFIVSIQLLKLTDVTITNGDRNVCLSVVEFLTKLVRVGKELELCWTDLLDVSSDLVTMQDDNNSVLRDWLMKQPIVLLQRGFAQLAVTCLSNYLTSNGLFDSSHWHKAITEMMMSPLFIVVGSVIRYHSPKTATQENVSSQFRSKLEDVIVEKHQCLSVVCICLSHSDVIVSQHRYVDLPFREWCNSVCTALTLSIGVSVFGESHIAAHKSHLIGSLKVTLAALRSLQHLLNTDICQDQCYSITEVLIDVLQIPSLQPKVVNMVLKQLLKCLVSLKEHSKQWSTRIYQILSKLLVSPQWEDRDSALEFISSILEACKTPILFCDCDTITLDVWRCMNDLESFVRASALRAIGQLTLYDEVLSPLLIALDLTPADIVRTVCRIAGSDTEAFARRSAVQLLSTWLENAKFSDILLSTPDHLEAEISQVVQSVLHMAIKDLDWDVKLQVLGFWENILNNSKFSSQTAAVEFLCTSGGANDLVAAAADHDKTVRRKSFAILKSIKDRMSVDEYNVESADSSVENFMKQLSTFNTNHEKHQVNHEDDDDDDAYSLLQDILACANESISSDCKLLDCY